MAEEGFSLVELMVVVLIIAILLAIGIPSFLGPRKRAQERATQASLRLALTAAKTVFTNSDNSYAAADENVTTGLPKVEPSITYVNSSTPSSSFKVVSVRAATREWAGAAQSASGTCFFIHDKGETRYGRAATGQPCTGNEALTASDSGY
jgi:prepilin-type N-terminal cleavage/methylation domain-containing protein